MVTVPPVVSSEIDRAEAFVFTVTFTPAAIKTTSLAPGTVPLSHMLVAPQLPLLVAVIPAARLIEAKSKPDRIVKTVKICFVFMVSFGGVGLVEIIYLCLESSSKVFNCGV